MWEGRKRAQPLLPRKDMQQQVTVMVIAVPPQPPLLAAQVLFAAQQGDQRIGAQRIVIVEAS